MKSLLQYIKGSRKGKEAHRLEKEAMKDPFLSDALDGYQAVGGNHVESIEEMRRRISRRTRSNRDSITKWSVAASLLICLGFGSYFWLNRQPGLPERVQSMAVMEEQEIPLEQAQEEDIAAPVAAAPAVAQVEALTIVDDDVAIADIVAEEEVQIAATSLARSKAIRHPQPVIGEKAYQEYLKKELIHPQDSLCKDVSGTVIVEFHINEQGRPVNLTVKQSLCDSADKEALRLIEKGSDWQVDTIKVSVPIIFNP